MRPIWKGALTFGLVTIENVEVPWAEIVKGFEYEKGQFRDFVVAAQIPPVYFEQPRRRAS